VTGITCGAGRFPPVAASWASRECLLGDRRSPVRIEEGLAGAGPAVVAGLERVDPVERVAVGLGVAGRGADRVPERQVGGEGGVEVAADEPHALAVAVGDALHPGAGEAVGLELDEDRGELGLVDAGPVLDGVTPLVGEHQGGGGSCRSSWPAPETGSGCRRR